MKMFNWTKSLLHPIRRFRDDQEGAVTMEFVIMLPLLFTWAVGSFLYYDAYRSLSVTNKVGFTIADIVSRYEEIDEDDFADLQELSERMLPFRNINNRLRISSFCYYDDDPDPQEGHSLIWSNAQNIGIAQLADDGSPLLDPDGQPVHELDPRRASDIPTDILPLMADQDTVVYVELYSTWQPLSNSIFGLEFTSKTWYVDLIIRPRFAQSIVFVDSSGNPQNGACGFDPAAV